MYVKKKALSALVLVGLLSGCAESIPITTPTVTTKSPTITKSPTVTKSPISKTSHKVKTAPKITHKSTSKSTRPSPPKEVTFVHAGSFCAASKVGQKGTGKNGSTYTCKGPKPYRWRR